MSAIGKAVASYQKVQMDMIGKLSIGSESMINEIPFYDEGYIRTQIERLKIEYDDVTRDLKIASELQQSAYATENTEKLKARMEEIEVKILYYAMNSFASLPLCHTLVKGKNIKAKYVVQALESYKNGEIDQAEEAFQTYFSDRGPDASFFLPNKIYGKILLKAGKIQEALSHLEYAVQLKVDDRELLMMLADAYEKTGQRMEKSVVDEVCQILGQGV